MNNYYKTIETKTDPAIILTNNAHDLGKGNILMAQYYYKGEDGEEVHLPKLEDNNVFYLCRDDIVNLIEALKEFL